MEREVHVNIATSVLFPLKKLAFPFRAKPFEICSIKINIVLYESSKTLACLPTGIIN